MAKRIEQLVVQLGGVKRYPGYPVAIMLLVSGWLAALFMIGGSGILQWMLGRFPLLILPILALMALCVLPGLALLRWCWGAEQLPWPERLVVAAGLGAGLPALILMAAYLLRLQWGVWQTIVYLVLACIALMIPRRTPAIRPQSPTTNNPWIGIVLVGLTLTGVIGRLYSIRDQVVGANLDSYHHTLVAQLLVEHGGLFTSWLPYVPLKTFTYHYGFHTLVAWMHLLTGIPVAELLPIVGQIIGAAIIPAIYTLTVRLMNMPIAGIAAALLIGFYNTQPAYYAVWGRYPFITSHLLLVAILCCWQRVLTHLRLQPGLLIMTALACAALAHMHYQTTIFAALFLFILITISALQATHLREVGQLLIRASLIGGLALCIALPWLLNTLGGNLDRNVAYNSEQQSGDTFTGVALPPLVPLYLKSLLVILALAGVLIAVRRKNIPVLMLGCWAAISQLAAIPSLFGLPGTGAIEPSLTAMMLYFTIGPLAGYAIACGVDLVSDWLRVWQPLLKITGLVLVVLITAWGIGWQATIVPPYARMVTPADMRAIAWIREHTPATAHFLINSNPMYGGLLVAGTDAGLWLPLLADRTTSVPPLSYGSELASDPAYIKQVYSLATALRVAPLIDTRARVINAARPDVLDDLRAAGITYIYLGAQPLRGPGMFREVDRIDPGTLRASPNFRIVYDADGVHIFELLPD